MKVSKIFVARLACCVIFMLSFLHMFVYQSEKQYTIVAPISLGLYLILTFTSKRYKTLADKKTSS